MLNLMGPRYVIEATESGRSLILLLCKDRETAERMYRTTLVDFPNARVDLLDREVGEPIASRGQAPSNRRVH